MKIGKDQKIYFNEVLKGAKFNNETLKGIAEMLSLFYYKKEYQMKNLEQIRQKSKEIKEKIYDTERLYSNLYFYSYKDFIVQMKKYLYDSNRVICKLQIGFYLFKNVRIVKLELILFQF